MNTKLQWFRAACWLSILAGLIADSGRLANTVTVLFIVALAFLVIAVVIAYKEGNHP